MPKPSFFKLNKHYQKALIDEATKVFNSKDYKKLKISDFSEAMDLPTGTFYEYFENKEDLTTYIASIAFQKKFDALGTKNIVLFTYKDEDFSLFSDEVDKIGDITYEKILNSGIGFFAKLFDEYLVDMMDEYNRKGIEENIKKGIYRDDINIRLSSYFMSLLTSFIYHYFEKYEINDPLEQEKEILELLDMTDRIFKK